MAVAKQTPAAAAAAAAATRSKPFTVGLRFMYVPIRSAGNSEMSFDTTFWDDDLDKVWVCLGGGEGLPSEATGGHTQPLVCRTEIACVVPKSPVLCPRLRRRSGGTGAGTTRCRGCIRLLTGSRRCWQLVWRSGSTPTGTLGSPSPATTRTCSVSTPTARGTRSCPTALFSLWSHHWRHWSHYWSHHWSRYWSHWSHKLQPLHETLIYPAKRGQPLHEQRV